MIRDEIVEEVRAVREDYARRFKFDPWAMYRDLKAREGSGGHEVVHLEEAPVGGKDRRLSGSR